MSAYRRDSDETKWCKLLEKYNEIKDKVSDSIKQWFDSKPVFSKKYLKTKEETF